MYGTIKFHLTESMNSYVFGGAVKTGHISKIKLINT